VKSRWYSQRLGCEATLARWGTVGQPVLLFPTAGGDAEEIERFLMIKALEPLLTAGRIKLYSCDSVAGPVWFNRGQHPGHRMWMQHQYHQWIRHEVVPAIAPTARPRTSPSGRRARPSGPSTPPPRCAAPRRVSRALRMSGTYNLMRFIEVDTPTEPFRGCRRSTSCRSSTGAHLDHPAHPLRAHRDGPGALGGR
jgi:esterase/lipase superfamily enzyme